MQILNMAVKLKLSHPQPDASAPTTLLLRYILDMCKYDLNYDLRDRARMFRQLCLSASNEYRPLNSLQDAEERLVNGLLAVKPSPKMISPFKGTD